MVGTFELFVSGKPVPQPRHRVSRGKAYIPKGHAISGWKARIRDEAILKLKSCGYYPPPGLLKATAEHKFTVHLTFTLGTPKRMRKGDCIDPITKPDLDNLAKAVLDALNGIVYCDDAQICSLVLTKRRARHGQGEGVAIMCHWSDNQC